MGSEKNLVYAFTLRVTSIIRATNKLRWIIGQQSINWLLFAVLVSSLQFFALIPRSIDHLRRTAAAGAIDYIERSLYRPNCIEWTVNAQLLGFGFYPLSVLI